MQRESIWKPEGCGFPDTQSLRRASIPEPFFPQGSFSLPDAVLKHSSGVSPHVGLQGDSREDWFPWIDDFSPAASDTHEESAFSFSDTFPHVLRLIQS